MSSHVILHQYFYHQHEGLMCAAQMKVINDVVIPKQEDGCKNMPPSNLIHSLVSNIKRVAINDMRAIAVCI